MLCVRATQPGGDGDTLPTDKSTASCRAGPVVAMPSVPVLAGRGTPAASSPAHDSFDLPSPLLFPDAALDTRDSWH
jgi:hypothetical protein